MRSGRGDEEAAGRAACVLEKLQLHLHPEATEQSSSHRVSSQAPNVSAATRGRDVPRLCCFFVGLCLCLRLLLWWMLWDDGEEER